MRRNAHALATIVVCSAVACSDNATPAVSEPGKFGADDGGSSATKDPGTSSDAGRSEGSAVDATPKEASAPAVDAGDAPSLGGCRMFPVDSVWNTEIVAASIHPLSTQYIAAVGASTPVHPDFGASNSGIPYVVVPSGQAMVPITFDASGDESDPGPYPIPPNAPIEDGGDLHVLALESGSCTLYELFTSRKNGAGWLAGSGAIWHLDRNEQRPDGWTSADAAGLPILPGLIRYDEVFDKKDIRHALRVTVQAAQSAYIYPAVHSDGTAGHDANHPPMGLRLRLKASVGTSGFSAPIQVILRALKTYGMTIADTGGDWFLSGAPDDRWDDSMLAGLAGLKGSDFEAVDTGAVHPYQ